MLIPFSFAGFVMENALDEQEAMEGIIKNQNWNSC